MADLKQVLRISFAVLMGWIAVASTAMCGWLCSWIISDVGEGLASFPWLLFGILWLVLAGLSVYMGFWGVFWIIRGDN